VGNRGRRTGHGPPPRRARGGSVPDRRSSRPGPGSPRCGHRPSGHRSDQVAWGGRRRGGAGPGVSRYRSELATAAASGVSVTTAMAGGLEDFATARWWPSPAPKGRAPPPPSPAPFSVTRASRWPSSATSGSGDRRVRAGSGRCLRGGGLLLSGGRSDHNPPVCVLTSLAPDHLDWHRGEEAYYRDKLRLIDAGPIGAIRGQRRKRRGGRPDTAHPARTLFGPPAACGWRDPEPS